MKKIISLLFVVSLFIVAHTASAQMGMMNYGQNSVQATSSSASTTAALQAIYQSQNVASQNQVDCSKVTQTQFENLGDAVMGSGITEQQHQAMEQGMGGEGSATLSQVHIAMGERFLGCPVNSNYGFGMMGGYGPGGHMGGYGIGGVLFFLVSLVVLVDLVLAGIWLWRQIRN